MRLFKVIVKIPIDIKYPCRINSDTGIAQPIAGAPAEILPEFILSTIPYSPDFSCDISDPIPESDIELAKKCVLSYVLDNPSHHDSKFVLDGFIEQHILEEDVPEDLVVLRMRVKAGLHYEVFSFLTNKSRSFYSEKKRKPKDIEIFAN